MCVLFHQLQREYFFIERQSDLDFLFHLTCFCVKFLSYLTHICLYISKSFRGGVPKIFNPSNFAFHFLWKKTHGSPNPGVTVLLVKGVSLLQVDRFHTTGPVTPALELEEAFADGNLMEKFKTHCEKLNLSLPPELYILYIRHILYCNFRLFFDIYIYILCIYVNICLFTFTCAYTVWYDWFCVVFLSQGRNQHVFGWISKVFPWHP